MFKPQGIYSDFIIYQPTLIFGENALYNLSSFSGSRVAIISGDSLNEKVKEQLYNVFKKKSVLFVTRSWKGEPDIESICASVSELEQFKPDVIIAIGGGSVIDGAKLCRLFYEFPYYKINETKLSSLTYKTSFIAIPTTIGSGSEISSAAVYINKAEKKKEMIVSHDMLPSVVVLNPELVKNAPEKVIIGSAIDALGHIVEGCLSNRDNELADILAEKALSIIYRELNRDERDYQSLQYAGYLGGIVQNSCIVGVAHAIAHQLSEYDFSHGEAVSFLLPSAIKVNIFDERTFSKANVLCANSGIKDIDELIKFIVNIRDKAISGEKKKRFIEQMHFLVNDDNFITNVVNDMGGKGNPIPITKELIVKIVEGVESGL